MDGVLRAACLRSGIKVRVLPLKNQDNIIGQNSGGCSCVICEGITHACGIITNRFLSDCNPPSRREVQEERPGSLELAGRERKIGRRSRVVNYTVTNLLAGTTETLNQEGSVDCSNAG